MSTAREAALRAGLEHMRPLDRTPAEVMSGVVEPRDPPVYRCPVCGYETDHLLIYLLHMEKHPAEEVKAARERAALGSFHL